MPPCFFYGSLVDPERLRRICGGKPGTGEPARLAGWRRARVAGADYPLLLRAVAGRVDGILVRGLDVHGLRRLDRYEGPGYRRARLRVATSSGRWVNAFVYLPRPVLRAGRRPYRSATVWAAPTTVQTDRSRPWMT